MSRVGDVVRLSTWTHHEPHDLRITFRHPDKKKVTVFVVLGAENKDGTEPLDLEKAMNDLGWWFLQKAPTTAKTTTSKKKRLNVTSDEGPWVKPKVEKKKGRRS